MSDYIGKRIVPKHCGEWDRAKEYEMLSIVLHTENGNSFITKREVPAGVEITDTSYWALCSEYNAQIEACDGQNDGQGQHLAGGFGAVHPPQRKVCGRL